MASKLEIIRSGTRAVAGLARMRLLRRRIPVRVSILVAKRCNLRCFYCYAKDVLNVPEVKEPSLDELKNVLDQIRALGCCWINILGGEPRIKVVAYFIIGYIGETEKTVRKTIRFACRLKPDFAAFFPATPMPGTRLCTEAENAGLVPKDYWRDFVLGKRGDALPFLIPDAGTWAARAYRRFCFSPAYLLRQLLALHSAKDLFGKARGAFNLLFMKFSRGKPAAGHTT